MFLTVGLLYGAGFILMCFTVKEGQYPPPDDIPEGSHPSVLAQARLYMLECLRHPYYRWVFWRWR
jgi:maltose/moltooligosaccharide transporter